MKKYINLSMFIFWGLAVAVAAAGLVVYDGGSDGQAITGLNTNITGQTDSAGAPITGVGSGTADLVLSPVELAKHNSSQSCWLLISGKIYDVTSYVRSHPGGAAEILNTCGTDATTAFATMGGQGSHSNTAKSILAGYYIGDLNQTLKINSGQTAASAKTNTATQTTQTAAQTTIPATTQTINTTQTSAPIVQNTTLALTSAELAKHNSSASCWTLVSGKVYDLTSYISRHPGGSSAVLSLCGADGTAAFVAQHGSSSAAQSALASLYIGDLNQTVTTSPTSSTISGQTITFPTIANPSFSPSVSGDDDDEHEDEDD